MDPNIPHDPAKTYLRHRLWSVASVVLFNILIAVLLIILVHHERLDAEEEAARTNANMARLLMEKVNDVFRTADGSLQIIIDKLRSSDFASNVSSERSQVIVDLIREHMQSFPLIGNIGIVDATGQARYVARGHNKFKVDDRRYYDFLRNNPEHEVALSELIHIRSGSNEPAILVARRIKNAETQFLGLGLTPVKLDFFSELIDQLRLDDKGVAALYSPDLVMLARRPEVPEMVGKPLPARDRVLSMIRNRPKGVIKIVSPVDGIKRIFSFHRTPFLGLIAVAGMSETDYLADWRRNRIRYGIGFLGLVVLSAVGLRQWLRSRKLHLDLLDSALRESRQNESFRVITESLKHPLVVARQSDRQIIHINKITSRTLGMAYADLLGHSLDEFLGSWITDKTTTEVYNAEVQVSRPDGSTFWASVALTPVFFQGEDACMVIIIDIDARKAREEDLSQKANYDDLTGFYSRGYFNERFQAAFAHARRHDRPLAVVTMDLDHFKNINDSYGHAAGDAALQGAATAVREVLREADITGRIGGEEFAMILVLEDETQALDIAERIRRSIAAAAIDIGTEHPLSITASLGVALLSPSDADPDSLLARADSALYTAKKNGRNRTVMSKL